MLSLPSNSFFRNLLLILLFYSGIFLIIILIIFFFRQTVLLSESALLNWDAAHYYDLMQKGYHDSNVAFFPLFPFVWKATHLSVSGMAILNGIIYCLSLAWLATEFNFQIRNLFIIASVPSLIFMFLPFSEASFYFAATTVLIGLKKANSFYTNSGLLLSGFARPVATIFMPAIFLTGIIADGKKKLKDRISYDQLIICLFSIFLVIFLQFAETGKWFTFFEYQKNWNNYLRMPGFPLSSWAGGYVVRLDAIAFFCGIFAFVWFIKIVAMQMKNNVPFNNKPLVFSLAYLSLLSLVILFTKGGVFNSFNRYLFASPFFAIALNSFLEQSSFRIKYLLLLILFSTLFWFLFASYVHIQTVLKFELLTLYLCLTYLTTYKLNKSSILATFLGITVLNVFFFIAFMLRFLSGGWVA